MAERKKYYCSVKGCTRQTYKHGMCKKHLKDGAVKEAVINEIDNKITKKNNQIIEKLTQTVTTKKCVCETPMKQLSDECVIRVWEDGSGYGACKIYHLGVLLHSAIGLIQKIKIGEDK